MVLSASFWLGARTLRLVCAEVHGCRPPHPALLDVLGHGYSFTPFPCVANPLSTAADRRIWHWSLPGRQGGELSDGSLCQARTQHLGPSQVRPSASPMPKPQQILRAGKGCRQLDITPEPGSDAGSNSAIVVAFPANTGAGTERNSDAQTHRTVRQLCDGLLPLRKSP